MCVNYRALNSLLPPVTKANSKAKGVLTLVPLPKIDEIYAALEGSVVYSTFDMRSGYYHICCDMGQNDTIGKIELIPSSVLSENNTTGREWLIRTRLIQSST